MKNTYLYVNIYMVIIEMKKKKTKIFIIVFIIITIVGISGFTIFNSLYSSTNTVKKVKTIDNIKKYNYILSDNSTKYYKELFKELKTILNENEINDEDYAKKITQLFITDLFTLSNKITSSDIGGVQYVYKDFQSDYIKLAQNGLYSSVKSNVYGDRKQELPEVSEVTIENTTTDTFTIKDKKYENAYYITAKIKYKKDLGYPSKYKIVLINNNKTMEIVKANETK